MQDALSGDYIGFAYIDRKLQEPEAPVPLAFPQQWNQRPIQSQIDKIKVTTFTDPCVYQLLTYNWPVGRCQSTSSYAPVRTFPDR